MSNKLYIWAEFAPDYADGLAFAIAGSETEAREMVIAQYGFDVDNWGTLEVRGMSKCARCVGGGA